MSILHHPLHTARDLARWREWERQDAVWARLPRMDDLEARALDDMARFCLAGPCWVGTSWGKESIIVAHLAWRIEEGGGPRIPVIWQRAHPNTSPDCDRVRDAFLSRFPVDYREHAIECPVLPDGSWGIDEGYDPHWHALHRWCPRHILGLRAEENGMRKRRMLRYGTVTPNTCAPIGFWKAADVYAYLYRHDLPIHPAYAMCAGGMYPRDRLRVAALGGEPGTGMGRTEWEARYYGAALREARAHARTLAEVQADQRAAGLVPLVR